MSMKIDVGPSNPKTDIGGWQTRLTDAMIAEYETSGRWAGLTIADRARDCAAKMPDATALVDGDATLSFRTLYARAAGLADAFRRRGLKPGDVVSFQLPNWHEALIINLAAAMCGVVVNPIVPIYRDSEVGFILRDVRAKMLFIPERLRSIDYVEMVDRIRGDLRDLQHVVLVRGEARAGYDSFAEWCPATAGEMGADRFDDVDANAVKLVLYTSGTTGVPKGVLHSHNTLGAEIDAFRGLRALTSDDVIFMPSPVTHIAGYLYGMELMFTAGIKTVLMERWNASEAVDLIMSHAATFTAAATPFLAEIVHELERRGETAGSLRFFGCGGAPVSPELVERAQTVLPLCESSRAYGLTEAPTISVSIRPGDPPELAAITDGSIVNNEVRIHDPVSGAILPAGAEGEIAVRGPEVTLGYADPAATAAAFDADGFFHTGDLGFVSHGTYVTITGRMKDLIIRGGENIAPKEIEDAIHRHPAVLETSVVAMPHARLGETPAAFVVLREGAVLEFGELIAFLEEQKLARQKLPEKLIVTASLPRNAAGKVLKHDLRKWLEQSPSGDAGNG